MPPSLSCWVHRNQTENAPNLSVPISRGATNTETGKESPSMLIPLGITVNRIVCSITICLSSPSLSCKCRRIITPNLWFFEQIAKAWITFTAKGPLDCQLDRLAEKRYLDFHCQRCTAICLVPPAVVGEA